MPKFQIYNIDAGEDLGTYEAKSADDALDAMACEYGFLDYADCVSEYGIDVESAKAELKITIVLRGRQ